jgi:predicted metal-dependent hydrolase
MVTQIKLGDIAVDIVQKDIKNIHLSVYPPTGKVRISAPLRMDIDTIRVFAITKLGWIKSQQEKLREQARETPREYLDRESHYLWGKRYVLQIVEKDSAPEIELKHNKMILRIRPATNHQTKQVILEAWYRENLKKAVLALITKWEPLMGFKVERFFGQKMKNNGEAVTQLP